eukprot:c24837_g1_i1 orf=894-1856(+)
MASLARNSLSKVEQPKFSFGIITDVQYADIPDGCSFLGVPRYYRHSLEVLKRAVISWNNHGGHSFAMNLGDIVDGYCPKESSRNTVMRIVNEFNAFYLGPVYHILGNHCLYNLPRNELNEILKIPTSDGNSYYTFCPLTGFRVVVLDGYDISAIGWPEGHPHTIRAVNILNKNNPNANKNSPFGLTGAERRFVRFNGGVGKEQLAWLDETLLDANACGQKVIICCHLSFHPDATDTSALLWNYEEVLHVIHRYECVKVCLAGHTHVGGYALDSHGIHHRVLEAALECPPGTDAFGHVDVYENRLSIVGTGCMDSVEIYFN